MTLGKKPDWKFYMFGGLRVERNGRDLDLPPYRCHDVLIYLLLNHASPIRRDRLIGEVFPSTSPGRARARLSDHLWLIRSSLPGLEIETSIEQIQIKTKNIWLDCLAFSGFINNTDVESLFQAMDLYKGSLVPDLYSDWIFLFRERYRNQYLNSLRTLAQQLYEAGQYTQAGEFLERLVAEEPFDESSVRLLMHTQVRLGRRGLAISVYEKYRLLCNEQLKVHPENDTQALYESILARATISKGSPQNYELTKGKPDELLKKARKALNEGDRFELLNLLRAASSIKDSHLALQRDLLHVDECIQWSDFPRAWQLLDDIQQENTQVELRRSILLIRQNNPRGAEQVLARVIRDATNMNNRELEANALLYISHVKLQDSGFQDALLAVNKSIHIATKIDKPIIAGKGYLQKARILYRQGANYDAREVLLQAQLLAKNHHFMCLLAEINSLLGDSFQRNGLYPSAYRVKSQALEIARDTGMRTLEAQILLGLAAACDFLGRKVECLRALDTARHIFHDLKDRLGLAMVDYNLAAAIPYHDETQCEDAIQHARSALEIFTETDQKDWQAVTHTALAFALWVCGKHDEAISNYEKAVKFHKALGEYGFIPELFAYIGLAHLGLGNVKESLKWTDMALQSQAMLNLSDIVTDIYYARGAALDSAGKSQEAIIHYQQGYQTLLDYAKDIEEEDARQAYFHRDPITRRLMQKVYELGLAPKAQQVSFQHKVAGTHAKRTEITLTVHAGPSDQALAQQKGSAALRRARLNRMLGQAKHQNVKLSLEELSNALKVSPRTVQRDLAAINSQKNNLTE